MAIGHIDIEKIKANRKLNNKTQKSKQERLEEQAMTDATVALYKRKEPIDNSRNSKR